MMRNRLVVCAGVFVALGVGAVLGQTMPAGGQGAATKGDGVQVPAAVVEGLKLPKGDERKKALTAAGVEWAGKEPEAALAWAVGLARDDGAVNGAVFDAVSKSNGKIVADFMVKNNTMAALGHFHGVMYVWGRTDPKAAAEWCKDAPANVRYVAYFSVGDAWYLKDSKAASEWAVSLTTDADRLAAIHGVALKWARASVPGVTVWIKTLKGQNLVTAAKAVVQDSRANRLDGGKVKDPAAVEKWVGDLGLSDAEKAEVLKGAALPPSTVKPAAGGK